MAPLGDNSIPKNAKFKVNYYWLMDYKINTMIVKMCRTESLETQDKLYSHVLTSDNFMANVHTTRKSSLLYDSLCVLTNENTGNLAGLVNVSI